jgi:hypothetical protein
MVKTAKSFESKLENDLGWRKKEISELYLLAADKPSDAIFKSLLLMIYAHWEGFIKKSSKLYLHSIAEEKNTLSELCINFKAIQLKSKIEDCVNSNDAFSIEHQIKFFSEYDDTDMKFDVSISPDHRGGDSFINTESNLSNDVLRRIYKIIGLHYSSPLETRGVFIDTKLVSHRNMIAHGDRLFENSQFEVLTLDYIKELKSVVFTILEAFQVDLLEHYHNKFYLASNVNEQSKYATMSEAKLEADLKAII